MAKQFMHYMAMIAGLIALTRAKNCQNIPGIANGECVRFYTGIGCDGQEAGSYKPSCEGNCYQYGFDYIDVAGDGTYGTNCFAYSDSNCQNYIGQTGNQVSVFGTETCMSFPGGQSMKCYYRC